MIVNRRPGSASIIAAQHTSSILVRVGCFRRGLTCSHNLCGDGADAVVNETQSGITANSFESCMSSTSSELIVGIHLITSVPREIRVFLQRDRKRRKRQKPLSSLHPQFNLPESTSSKTAPRLAACHDFASVCAEIVFPRHSRLPLHHILQDPVLQHRPSETFASGGQE